MSFDEGGESTWDYMYILAFLYVVILPVLGWKMWAAGRTPKKSSTGS